MPRLVWDTTGERYYETGVNCGVLYPRADAGDYPKGVVWNGLTTVTESPSGAEATPIYADNIKYLNLISAEEFGATVEAYTYPDEFALCDGTGMVTPGVYVGQQTRRAFGLAYKTILGNDVQGNNLGYKLHLIYGALASPSEKSYTTVNDSPEAITFSWEVTTTPVSMNGFKPTASITIDSTKVSPAALTALENILYGTEASDAYLPLPDEVAAIFENETPPEFTVVSTVPAHNATNVALDANIVITFSNKVKSENVFVIDSTAAIAQTTKSFDGTGKVLTVKPATGQTWAADSRHGVILGTVVDVYGNAMEFSAKMFTTASE